MARSLGRILRGFQRLGSLSSSQTHLIHPPPPPSPRFSVRTTSVRTVVDFSLPNSSWSSEMMQLYERYNSQCEVQMEGGEQQKRPWQKMPSYSRLPDYPTGGVYLSETIQSKACFFTRNIRNPGAGFEYAMFINIKEQKCVCIFQAGPLLEGVPGHVHGGAIVALIDTVIGAQAAVHCGPVMTANFNIDFRSPVKLGSTVLLESCVDKKEGRKIFLSCKVTSNDGSKVHTETRALFLTISASNLVQGVRRKHGSLPPEATASE